MADSGFCLRHIWVLNRGDAHKNVKFKRLTACNMRAHESARHEQSQKKEKQLQIVKWIISFRKFFSTKSNRWNIFAGTRQFSRFEKSKIFENLVWNLTYNLLKGNVSPNNVEIMREWGSAIGAPKNRHFLRFRAPNQVVALNQDVRGKKLLKPFDLLMTNTGHLQS